MNETILNPDDVGALTALCAGILPADERDAGAAVVNAGPVLGERARFGATGPMYLAGLRQASTIAQARFSRAISLLNPAEIHELLGALELEAPKFFRQLRVDVCTLYLSDPAVWERIGFPGPSIERGGYPDFDQPQ